MHRSGEFPFAGLAFTIIVMHRVSAFPDIVCSSHGIGFCPHISMNVIKDKTRGNMYEIAFTVCLYYYALISSFSRHCLQLTLHWLLPTLHAMNAITDTTEENLHKIAFNMYCLFVTVWLFLCTTFRWSAAFLNARSSLHGFSCCPHIAMNAIKHETEENLHKIA